MIVGRESELAALRSPPRALVLTGGPGIGKTTLWEAAVGAARKEGATVLVARPTGAETQHSFAALADLFDGVDITALPAPQRSALDVALLRAAPTGAPPSAYAIALGVLNALRDDGPLVVALDDVQWLDGPSAQALTFAARRLEDAPVRFLLARRPGRRTVLERALDPLRLPVGALDAAAIRRLLAERLGLRVPRPLLLRIVEMTQGNPLFALEQGRVLVERGVPDLAAQMPVPDGVEELLGTRVAALPEPVRRALVAVALSGDLHVGELAAVVGRDAVDDALDGGLLLARGDRLRASHPLLAAAARGGSGRRERRELHRALADAVGDDELRARHLALAADRPDARLADAVGEAAARTSARGASAAAVELAEHALRLTPDGAPERAERVIALGAFLERAGERRRVTELLTPALASLPAGEPRVRALLLLLDGSGISSFGDSEAHLDRALREAGDDPALRAPVLAALALATAAEGVVRIPEAEGWALEAQPLAEAASLRALGWARSLRGLPIDDVCARFATASQSPAYIADSPEVVAGLRALWRGNLESARATFAAQLALADERGEAMSYAWLRLNMCELELKAGAWDAVSRWLDEWAESGDRALLVTPTYRRCRALLAAGRGLPEEAAEWAALALEEAETLRYGWQILEARRALATAALLAGDPAGAVVQLRAVWDWTAREGIDEPGAFPVAPDLVEALVELGEPAEAQAVTQRLRDLAERQEHAWGLATARRCEAVIRLAAGYDERAAGALAEVASAYDALGLRPDAARTLLSLGRTLRRHRRWGAARTTLEAAATAFATLGSPGWAERAEAELARVSARRPVARGELTAAERRVVELAAAGRANKEIAQALFVSVRTVEAHLTHAYAKLGVRSRAQLAQSIAASDERSETPSVR
jgi:DNA-binding CsgD family transcriptional regulator